MLVSFVRFGGSLADALLRPGIHIFDIPGVGGGEVVELIHPVTNRAKLALHVFLAREGIDLAPESLPQFGLIWLAASASHSPLLVITVPPLPEREPPVQR